MGGWRSRAGGLRALAYRGLFALLPFALFLVAVLSFLRVDALLIWLAGLGRPGCGGRSRTSSGGSKEGS